MSNTKLNATTTPTNTEKHPRKATVWTKDKISHLIQLYRSHECLWNHYEETYRSKEKRSKAIDNICKTLRITKFDFGRKIHNLRNQFNSEMKKLERRVEESGGDTADIGTSKGPRCRWEHFDSLMFLRNVIEPRPNGFQGSFLTPKQLRVKYEEEMNDINKETKVLNGCNNTTNVGANNDELTEYHLEETDEDNTLGDHIDDNTDDFQNYDAEEEVPAAKEFEKKLHSPIETNTNGNCVSNKRDVKITSLKTITNNSAIIETNANKTFVTTVEQQVEENPQGIRELPSSREHTTILPVRDQWDTFGEMISNELRMLSSEISRRKLKRKILQCVLEVGQEDESYMTNPNFTI